MVASGKRSWKTPRESDLGLHQIENRAGLSISVLPNGCIFAIEHRRPGGATMFNQLLGSPIDGGIARLYLRIGGAAHFLREVGVTRCSDRRVRCRSGRSGGPQ